MGWRSSDEEANLHKRGYKGIHMCQLWNHKDELDRHVEAEQGYSKNSRILHGNKDLMDIRENASGYYIYRKSGKRQYALLKKVAGANTLAFNDTKVTSGVIYTYKVQAYKGTVVGAGTEASRCFVGTAKAKTANESTGIKLSWNKVGGARSYKIYKRIGTGKYTCIKTASSTTFTYLDKAVKAGTIYTYAVKPYIGRTAGTYVASKYVRLRPVTAKVSAARNGVTVRWTKTAGATSYRVYRKTASGKYALVKKSAAQMLSAGQTRIPLRERHIITM